MLNFPQELESTFASVFTSALVSTSAAQESGAGPEGSAQDECFPPCRPFQDLLEHARGSLCAT